MDATYSWSHFYGLIFDDGEEYHVFGSVLGATGLAWSLSCTSWSYPIG